MPTTTLTPSDFSDAMIAGAWSALSMSRTSSTTCRPPMPPAAFTRSAAIRTPRSSSPASDAADPEIGKTAPIRIGDAEAQPARASDPMTTDAIAAPKRAVARLMASP